MSFSGSFFSAITLIFSICVGNSSFAPVFTISFKSRSSLFGISISVTKGLNFYEFVF
jgi:hypothetical protein